MVARDELRQLRIPSRAAARTRPPKTPTTPGHAQLPRGLVRAAAQAFGPLLSDVSGPVLLLPTGAARHPNAMNAITGANSSGGGGPPGLHGGGGGWQPAAVAVAVVEPSPEAMETLVGMGFDRSRAAAALQRTGNDVQAAIAQLVS